MSQEEDRTMTDRWDDLDRAAEAATPGPWHKATTLVGRAVFANDAGRYVYPEDETDGRYIALADPTTIRELIADNRRLREALGMIALLPSSDAADAVVVT